MSGIVTSNVFRGSGVIAATAAGISFESSVTTGTTLTVSAGNGYFIDTTSNICTVTLPSSAERGDQIILVDFARTWGTNSVFIDSNGLNFQTQDDTYIVEYATSGATVNLIYSDATTGWTPISDDVVTDTPVQPPTQKGLFGYGANNSGTALSMSNLINSSGVVATDTTGVGTVRETLAACSYGGDKAIFGFGRSGSPSYSKLSMTNLVNNSGVIASDVTGTGTARAGPAAASYGGDKAIFAYGDTGSQVNTINLVTNVGVMASDSTGTGTARTQLAATGYGLTGQAIFGYGMTGSEVTLTNLVSNTGVVASDVSGVSNARRELATTTFGSSGQALFAYGYQTSLVYFSTRNLISNTGVVASSTSGAGTARAGIGGTNYGGDKGIFAYGNTYSGGNVSYSMSNLVSNTGVIASDTTGVGTVRTNIAAAGYSFSA